MEITSLEQLDSNKTYTHKDYYSWKFPERTELINGKLFVMDQTTWTVHQTISREILGILFQKISKKSSIYTAPFDVRLNENTVIQPDISIFKDEEKLDERGGIGIPETIFEIVAPTEVGLEYSEKFNLYEEYKLPEYFIISSKNQTIEHFILNGNKFEKQAQSEYFESAVFPDLKFSATEIFENLD